MSDTSSSSTVTSAEMLADAVAHIQQLVKSVRKDGRKFEIACDGLDAALDESRPEAIQRYRALLDQARRMLDLNMTEVQEAQETIARLRADPTLKATRADAIEKLAQAVAQARRTFIQRVQRARDLDARAEGTSAALRQDQRQAEVALGALRLRVRGTLHTLNKAADDAERLAAAARKAYEKKDQKALTAARTALIDLKAFDGNVRRLRPEVDAFSRQHPNLAREQKVEVQGMLDDLVRVEDVPATIDRRVKETLALGQVPVEPKPARTALAAPQAQQLLKAFGLPDDAAQRAKAARILAGEAVDAWPRGLARLYGCSESALKARLGAVRKFSFVKSREVALIDL